MNHKKSLEEYRRRADKCRETARMVSAENGRANLLSMAQTWDLIADRLEASRADGERSAVTHHDSPPVYIKPAPAPPRGGRERRHHRPPQKSPTKPAQRRP